jgi:hypothetical protein
MAQRMAGSPGVRERVLGFLGDNAYTRAWRDGVMVPVGMAERRMNGDVESLRGLAAELAGERLAAEVKQPGGYLGTPLAESFAKVSGVPADFDLGSQAAFGLPEGYRVGIGRELAGSFSEMSPEKARAVIEWAQQNAAARRPMTTAGGAVELALAGAPAAYGVPLMGAGLAAWGVNDVLAAQRAAEEERRGHLMG